MHVTQIKWQFRLNKQMRLGVINTITMFGSPAVNSIRQFSLLHIHSVVTQSLNRTNHTTPLRLDTPPLNADKTSQEHVKCHFSLCSSEYLASHMHTLAFQYSSAELHSKKQPRAQFMLPYVVKINRDPCPPPNAMQSPVNGGFHFLPFVIS